MTRLTSLLPDLRSRLTVCYLLIILVFGVAMFGVVGNEQSLRQAFTKTVRDDGQLTQDVVLVQKLMDDQETGLRGYLLTADPAFLRPYWVGRKNLPKAMTQIDALTARTPSEASLVRHVSQDAFAWQQWAARTIHARRSGKTGIQSQKTGKALFDHFRLGSAQALETFRRHELGDLTTSVNGAGRSTVALLIAFVVGLVLIGLLGIAIIRAVTRPLAALHASAKRIGGGSMVDPVLVSGAKEFTALGDGLDWMRQQLRSQYDQVQAVNRELQQRESQYRLLAENSSDMISRHAIDGMYLYVSPACRRLLGYEPEELVGHRANDFYHPDDLATVIKAREAVLQGTEPQAVSYRMRHKDDHYLWLESVAKAVRDESGTVVEIQTASRDISERVRMEEERTALVAREHAAVTEAKATRVLEGVLRSAPVAIMTLDAEGTILSWNPQAEKLFGWTEAEVLGRQASSLLVDGVLDRADIARIMAAREVCELELRQQAKDGRGLDLDMSVSPLLNVRGESIGVTIVLVDVTERKRAEDELIHQATHDALTDLPNRVLLHDRVQHSIELSRRSGQSFALLLLDLNRFKEINDTFGHHLGDSLLKVLSERLRRLLRDSDTVARLGGDEFSVILPGVDEKGATIVAHKILAAAAEPFVLEAQRFVVDASLGVSMYPEHGEDVETLLRHADVAMYGAKTSHSEIMVYNPNIDEYHPEHVTLLGDLVHALERNQLELFYQPKIRLETGTVDYVEALLRWNHPDRGFIPPNEFIPLVERTDLIRPLTMWVVKAAMRQCRMWFDSGIKVRVAVNLSAWNLHDAKLPDAIARILSDCSASPEWLKLEVTESTVMTNPEHAMIILSRLAAMGISLSIDDFGTGYSSLAYLKRLPVNEIKIDRSFVMDMSSNEEDATIVRSVVDLGHSLKLEVVAEGVEDRETLDLLRDCQCDLAQGFYLSRPIPAGDLTEWLKSWNQSRHLPIISGNKGVAA